jgi:hypothetical protein
MQSLVPRCCPSAIRYLAGRGAGWLACCSRPHVPNQPGRGGVVRRGERRHPQRDLRGPRGAAGDGAGAARPAAVAAGQHRAVTRKVDRLSCVRFGSARCDEHYGGPRPAPRRASGPDRGREGVLRWGRSPRRSSPAPLQPGHPAETRAGRAEYPARRPGGQQFLAALDRAVAFSRWSAADVRSILAARAGAPQPRAAGTHSPWTCPPSRAGRCRTTPSAPAPPTVPGERGALALAPDLPAGMRRLKLAAMRKLAPELLLTAKPSGRHPRISCAPLVEARITARDASNARGRLKAAAFPVTTTLDDFDVPASSVPAAALAYLTSLEWIRARENLCLVLHHLAPRPSLSGHAAAIRTSHAPGLDPPPASIAPPRRLEPGRAAPAPAARPVARRRIRAT